MVDFPQELSKREHGWIFFVKFLFTAAAAIAVLMLLMWIFLT